MNKSEVSQYYDQDTRDREAIQYLRNEQIEVLHMSLFYANHQYWLYVEYLDNQ